MAKTYIAIWGEGEHARFFTVKIPRKEKRRMLQARKEIGAARHIAVYEPDSRIEKIDGVSYTWRSPMFYV